MRNRDILSQTGSSFVELTIATLVMIIFLFSLANIVRSQGQDNKTIRQKLEALNLNRSLIDTFQDINICSCLLTPPVSNPIFLIPGATERADLQVLRKGCAIPYVNWLTPNSALPHTSTDLRISNMSFRDSQDLGGNLYRSTLTIEFDPSSMPSPIRPVTLTKYFETDPSTHQILRCHGEHTSKADFCQAMGGTYSNASQNCTLGAAPPTQATTGIGSSCGLYSEGIILANPAQPNNLQCCYTTGFSSGNFATDPWTNLSGLQFWCWPN